MPTADESAELRDEAGWVDVFLARVFEDPRSIAW